MGPAMSPDPNIAPSASPPPAHHHRRRQYAAGQTQAYYGSQDAMSAPVYGAPAPAQQQQQPAQLFTPGLATEGHVQQPGAQPPYYPGAPAEPEYINAPQQPGYSQPPAAPMGGLADQFNQMSMGGQKGPRLYTTNLLTSPPDPRELYRPPPEIFLPPGSCTSQSPFANADASYQRSTLNAIPTSNSLLKKANIPLGLILTPYRSVKEGDQEVPVVTDTVIARCRRCRTYINPYVQFIDGGNRYVADYDCMSNACLRFWLS